MKNRIVAILLAIFLGWLGIHKFYLDKNKQGILYLIFCWTGIPLLISLFDAIVLLITSDDDFNKKYGHEGTVIAPLAGQTSESTNSDISHNHKQGSALKKCPFCSEEIQVAAIVCKHCKRELDKNKVKKKEYEWTSKRIGCATIGIFFVIAIMIAISDSPPSSDSEAPVNEVESSTSSGNDTVGDSTVIVIARNFVKRHLQYLPGSEFPGFLEEAGIVKREENIYTITNWVDAMNGFGAKKRTYYVIKLQYNGGDRLDMRNWSELEFNFE